MTTAVRMKPIIFSGPMIRAIQENRKSMTRRLVKPQPNVVHSFNGEWLVTNQIFRDNRPGIRCPYPPGTLLWVRESIRVLSFGADVAECFYEADGHKAFHRSTRPYDTLGKKSAMFMPKRAARIWLEVTAVKCERVQDISAQDCAAEGIPTLLQSSDEQRRTAEEWAGGFDTGHCQLIRVHFRDLWDSIHGPGAWERNDWVWAYSFKRVEAPKVRETGHAPISMRSRRHRGSHTPQP